MWKICLSGTDVAIEGCESMTAEEVTLWIKENQINLDEANEHGDTTKYVALDI
jgi:hypothetical protein